MPRFFRFLFIASFPVLLCACGGSTPEQSKEDEQPSGKIEEEPAKEPDPAAIAKLVKQLGSSNFSEREKATKDLEAIGFPALDALRTAAKNKDAEVAQRAARLVAIIENGFDQLLADYRAYGLPLPPEDAKLVRFVSGGGGIVNDKLMPPTYFLGFLIEPGKLLVGTQEYRLGPGEIVEPKPELVKNIEPRWWGPATFGMNDGLAIALQCKARGWNDLARELWTVSIKQFCGHLYGGFSQRANLPARTAVAYLAWAHYANELAKPGTDRAKIAQHIKNLFAAEKSLDTQGNRALLTSLEAALVPSTAQPGTIERLIDDLIEVSDTAPLESKGFAAVPALIEHLDDDRVTRSTYAAMNNFPPWHRRVKHIVSYVLRELAGEELGKDSLRLRQGYTVEKADAQAWWDKAQKVGEETYFVNRVLPSGPKADGPNLLMLRFISEKYPEHLPKLYKTILDERPHMQSWHLAEAIGKSSLTVEQKMELFLYACRNKNLEHRRFGLTQLQKLDPNQFMTILLATLEALPKTPAESYWSCPEAAYAHLVLATDDPKAWELLEKVAKRSDVGLRMEFMNPMNYSYVGERQRQQRLKFLAAFLDDAESPDVKAKPEMFSGPHAGFTFARLSVQDLAAMKIASILEMPDQPDRNWTPEQWEKLREKVKQALKQ
jgi:hypothetical protein